jgi:hypothetical protein
VCDLVSHHLQKPDCIRFRGLVGEGQVSTAYTAWDFDIQIFRQLERLGFQVLVLLFKIFDFVLLVIQSRLQVFVLSFQKFGLFLQLFDLVVFLILLLLLILLVLLVASFLMFYLEIEAVHLNFKTSDFAFEFPFEFFEFFEFVFAYKLRTYEIQLVFLVFTHNVY